MTVGCFPLPAGSTWIRPALPVKRYEAYFEVPYTLLIWQIVFFCELFMYGITVFNIWISLVCVIVSKGVSGVASSIRIAFFFYFMCEKKQYARYVANEFSKHRIERGGKMSC